MFLGIEIGGTKLQLALGAGAGILAARWRGTVEPAKGAAGIREQIQAAVPALLRDANLSRHQVRGVGVGFGGPVDDATRTVIKSHQIKGWDNFPLADWIQELLGWPTALGNDADVAGLAEALFGAGKGLSPIFYITIGSGIGGGLIINGEIYRGCGRGAAEFGHQLMDWGFTSEGGVVVSGVVTTLESLASGWALTEHAESALAMDQGTRSKLFPMLKSEPGALTPQHIAQAALAGDGFAHSLLERAWIYLARGIAQVIVLLCPRRIVIGGGVSLIGEDLLFKPLRELVAAQVFEPFAKCYDIVPAALGEDVVVHGALALARKQLSPP